MDHEPSGMCLRHGTVPSPGGFEPGSSGFRTAYCATSPTMNFDHQKTEHLKSIYRSIYLSLYIYIYIILFSPRISGSNLLNEGNI
jgi:hypothetical protein